MLKRDDNKVGVWEYTAVLMLCIGLKPTDTLPTNLYKVGKNAGWMIPLAAFPIAIISLYCMLKLLKKYKDKNYIEIIYALMGKYIGAAICLIIFINATALTITNVRSYTDIISILYFPRTPPLVHTLVLVGSSYIMVRLGFEAIGRTAWMALPWILVAMILFIVLILNMVKIDYIYPIAGSGVKEILKGGVTYSTIFSEFITFGVVFTQIKEYEDFKRASYFTITYTAVQISFLCALYVMVLDYPAVIINNYPFHTVARLIYGGRFISNLEAFFLIFWIIASVVRFAMYIYTNTLILTYTLKMKDYKPLFGLVCVLVFILALLPENYTKNIIVIRKFIFNYGFIPMFLTPCLMLFLSRWRKVGER